MARARAPMTKEAFVNQSASTELGRSAAAMLWDKLVALKAHDEFSPYPSDELLRVYGVAEEDLDIDIILDILKALNCRIPGNETLQQIGPINTPRDVVRLVEASGR